MQNKNLLLIFHKRQFIKNPQIQQFKQKEYPFAIYSKIKHFNHSSTQKKDMLEIKATNTNNLQCYLLTIRQKHFISIGKPDLSNLKNFNCTYTAIPQNIVNKNGEKSQSSSENNLKSQDNKIQEQKSQQQIKSQQNHRQNDFSRLKVHLDLNYIKEILNFIQNHPNCPTMNVIVTDYQQFLILPYIVKKLHPKKQIKIFTTHIAYEIGKIYLKNFFTRITQFDLLQSHPYQMSFDEQSRLEDEFYIKFGADIKTWSKIFTQQDMILALGMVQRMNYGEIYDADGVSLSPLPSGYSLGSCCWMFQNLLTKETLLFIRQISTQKWRSIAQYRFFQHKKEGQQKQKQPFKQKTFKNVDLLILANSSVTTQFKEKPQIDIQMLLHKILVNLQKGLNTEVILEDELVILDIIDFISFQFKDKFKGIFISNPQFSQIVSYANSYVEFLSQGFKDRIYNDPPQYPFDSYLILKQRGFLFTGNLYDISEKQKVPLRQLMRRAQPYVYFRSQIEDYLQTTAQQRDKHTYKQTQHLSPTLTYPQIPYFPPSQLNSIIKCINPKKIVSYTNILPYIQTQNHQNVAILSHNKQFNITSTAYNHYLSKNISPNIINKYEFVDGFIMAYPVNREFLRLNSGWKLQIEKHLKDLYRSVMESGSNVVRTKCTELKIQDYQITIKSTDLNEMLQVLQIISAITKTLRLK